MVADSVMPFLQEEGPLFIQELLNKELSSKETGMSF